MLCTVHTNRTNGPRGLASYEYDAEKRRSFKSSSPGGTRYFTYSGWSLLCETLTTDHFPLTTYFVWGRDLSGTLDGAGGVFAMHNAQCIMHNSPDSCEGQPRPHSLCIVHYELCIDGPARPASFFILHSAFCIDAGLYYYGYRYYSPELGRWLTRDPIEEEGGDNLYAFCGNNACASFDSFGKKCVVVSGPQIKTDAVWELEKIKFKSISDDAHTLLYGIYGYWRILGEVTCECKRFWSGKSCTIIKDVYKRKTPQNKEDYSAIDPDCHECFVDIPNPVALPIDIPLFTSIKEGFKEIIKSVLSEVLTKVFAEGGAILQPGVLQDISSAIMNDVPSSSDGKWPQKLCK